MTDSSSVISSTVRPADMNVGTILILSNGQVWRVVSGSYSNTSATEEVIVYNDGVTHWMSFQSSGALMEVELMP